MADLSAEANLNPDEPVPAAVSKLSVLLWDKVWRHASGTSAGDAEALHDMRVALRRLRSMLQNFEGPAEDPLIGKRLRKEFTAQRRRLGKMGDLLGAVRDHDVLAAYLRSYARDRLRSDLAQCDGLAQLERHLQTERAAAFAPMVKRINRAQEAGGLREEFARWALGLPAATAPALTLRDAAAIILPLRTDEVRVLGASLSQGADAAGHHEFRKALRRLRYALESLGVCFAEPLKPHLRLLMQAQDLLGEMQDREVLRETALCAFDMGPESTHLLPPDLTKFLRWGELRRRSLLGQARKWWAAQENAAKLDEIDALLERKDLKVDK